MHPLGRLDGTERALGEGDDVVLARFDTRFQLHRHLHRLAPFVVGNAEHHAFIDRRVPHHRSLDNARIHIEAAADDDVPEPVLQEQIAAPVQHTAVAGMQPAAGEGLGGRLGHVEIARHDERALHHHLALDAGADQISLLVHDRDPGEQTGAADRGEVARIGHFLRSQIGDHLGRLGLAVIGGEHRSEGMLGGGDPVRRHRRAAVDQAPQRRKRACRAAELGQHHVDHGRRDEGGGDRAGGERLEHRRRLQVALAKHHGAAHRENRRDVARGAVGERRGDQIAVPGPEPEPVNHAGGTGQPRTVGLQHPLRTAARAAGELDRLGLLGAALAGDRPRSRSTMPATVSCAPPPPP